MKAVLVVLAAAVKVVSATWKPRLAVCVASKLVVLLTEVPLTVQVKVPLTDQSTVILYAVLAATVTPVETTLPVVPSLEPHCHCVSAAEVE